MSRMIELLPRTIAPLAVRKTQTKAGVYSIMAQFGMLTFGGRKGSSYQGYVNSACDAIYMFHAQKFRRKVERTPINRSKKNRHVLPRYTPNVLREGHWVVTIYRFDLADVVSAKQNPRNFKVVLK